MATVGDSSWIGVDEYLDPESVAVGYFSRGENTRVEKGQITGRGGHVPVQWGQSSYSATPTTLGTSYGAVEYVDNVTKRNQFLTFGASGAWLTEVSGTTTFIPYPGIETMMATGYKLPVGNTNSFVINTGIFAITSNPVAVQALNTVYLFRGDGIIPLQFPDHNGNPNFDLVYTDLNNPVAGGAGGDGRPRGLSPKAGPDPDRRYRRTRRLHYGDPEEDRGVVKQHPADRIGRRCGSVPAKPAGVLLALQATDHRFHPEISYHHPQSRTGLCAWQWRR